jgi:hypothetical protein
MPSAKVVHVFWARVTCAKMLSVFCGHCDGVQSLNPPSCPEVAAR